MIGKQVDEVTEYCSERNLSPVFEEIG